MTPEFEQLATFVEHELINERCRHYCQICEGNRPGFRRSDAQVGKTDASLTGW